VPVAVSTVLSTWLDRTARLPTRSPAAGVSGQVVPCPRITRMAAASAGFVQARWTPELEGVAVTSVTATGAVVSPGFAMRASTGLAQFPALSSV
jgi:hypothetical protein